MDLIIARNRLIIWPERQNNGISNLDLAYIEEVLGLKKEGDWIRLVRRDCVRSLVCLETVGEDPRKEKGKWR